MKIADLQIKKKKFWCWQFSSWRQVSTA